MQEEYREEAAWTAEPQAAAESPQAGPWQEPLPQEEEEALLPQLPCGSLRDVTDKKEVLMLLADMMRSEDTSAQHRLKAIELLVKYTGLFDPGRRPEGKTLKIEAEKVVEPWMH